MAEIDWKEARRYLGLHRPGGRVDPGLEGELLSCGRELTAAARPRAVWRAFPLTLGEGGVSCAGMEIPSAYLRRHLDGCTGVYLFAATLGAETDRLLRRSAVSGVSRAVILQACAASLLEAYCDECCARLAEEAAGEGAFLRPRFSPGYGDFSVVFQRPLLEALEAAKRIGLGVTETMMLTPTKSVTALVGRAPDRGTGLPGGCEGCGQRACAFRRARGASPAEGPPH